MTKVQVKKMQSLSQKTWLIFENENFVCSHISKIQSACVNIYKREISSTTTDSLNENGLNIVMEIFIQIFSIL